MLSAVAGWTLTAYRYLCHNMCSLVVVHTTMSTPSVAAHPIPVVCTCSCRCIAIVHCTHAAEHLTAWQSSWLCTHEANRHTEWPLLFPCWHSKRCDKKQS